MKMLWSLSCLFLLPALTFNDDQESTEKTQTKASAPPSSASDLIVHEWGTFTTVAGSDGAALEWRPLLGKTSDLPSFVYGTDKNQDGSGLRSTKAKPQRDYGGKKLMRGTVRMETPVLYFYTQRQQRISVRVDFPGGKITEWYPRAQSVGSGIDWGQIDLRPDYLGSFPREKGDNHYYRARETDAVPVQVTSASKPVGEQEKFLFYRGVGTFLLPLRATLSDGEVLLENRSKKEIPSFIVFERNAEGIRIAVRGGLHPNKPIGIQPTANSSERQVHRRLQRMLEEQGLYRREALSMVETWKDHWFSPGLRVFYLLPTRATDAILPLTITPKPKDIVRVLVGRIEILTDAQKKEIRGLAMQLGAKDFASRERATKGLIHIGRFAAPVLEQILLDSKDLEVRARIESLLKR